MVGRHVVSAPAARVDRDGFSRGRNRRRGPWHRGGGRSASRMPSAPLRAGRRARATVRGHSRPRTAPSVNAGCSLHGIALQKKGSACEGG